VARPIPIVALVGDFLRHRWYAARFANDPRFELRAVVSERQPAARSGETEQENRLIADHFAQRDKAEEEFFGDAPAWEELGETRQVERGATNEEPTAAWVRSFDPTYLVLYGSSIIREPLLAEFSDRTVNIHLGLSPYYKGHATNFWPLVNGEPECVGATIHLATLSVDAGPILRQVRPDPEAGDGSHELGCKAIIAGSRAHRDAVAAHAAEALEPKAQEAGGRLYKRADFSAAAVEEMRRRFADGMIADYLRDKPARDDRFPIVE
jgi:folate-dependent phosphoribosylglycinamide formyltransferase PurN